MVSVQTPCLKLPLPLGEGWGEGLTNTKSSPPFGGNVMIEATVAEKQGGVLEGALVEDLTPFIPFFAGNCCSESRRDNARRFPAYSSSIRRLRMVSASGERSR